MAGDHGDAGLSQGGMKAPHRWPLRGLAGNAGDPIAGWRHDAAIKVPIGQDTEFMLASGALLFERAARKGHVDAQTTLIQARNAYDDGLVRYRVALAALQTLTGTLQP